MRKVRRRRILRTLFIAAGFLTAAGLLYVVLSLRPRRAVTTAPPSSTEREYAPAVRLSPGKASVAERLREFGEPARERLRSHFRSAGVAYPPKRAAFIALKQEKQLQLYAQNAAGKWRIVYAYRILAASGRPGPKLRLGDYQVPEGVYRVTYLNPNSKYHVALRLNYPNAFDREMARRDGRTELGGDIMIHGYDRSIGCLAMGDAVSEDLFTLAADIGQENFRVLLCPTDLRVADFPADPTQPAWVKTLYANLRSELSSFAPPTPTPERRTHDAASGS